MSSDTVELCLETPQKPDGSTGETPARHETLDTPQMQKLRDLVAAVTGGAPFSPARPPSSACPSLSSSPPSLPLPSGKNDANEDLSSRVEASILRHLGRTVNKS